MSMANRIGQKFGPYELTQLLGRGGFAEVYLGRNVQLPAQQVAIKVLFKPLVSTKSAQFKQEANHLLSLSHPHIVKLLSYDSYSNPSLTTTLVPYIVMDYASKGSLRRNHFRGVSLPLDTIVTYVEQIADALQYAHDNAMMHLDVKPENVLVGNQNQLLLSDFGLAALLSDRNASDDVQGTLSYMAPEQLQGKPGFASDQYALGIMVYEWLSGSVPFTGMEVNVVIDKHLHVVPPSLRAVVPGLGPGIEAVVMRALAKKPEDRYAKISDFAREFKRAVQQAGVSSRANATPNSFANPPVMPAPGPVPGPSSNSGSIPNTPFPPPSSAPLPPFAPDANNWNAPLSGSFPINQQQSGNVPIPGNPDSVTIADAKANAPSNPPVLPPIPPSLINGGNSADSMSQWSTVSEMNLAQITSQFVKPRSAYVRRRERLLLRANIVANSLAAIFIGIGEHSAGHASSDQAWWTFLCSCAGSIGAFWLFFISSNKMLKLILSMALTLYWAIAGAMLADLLGGDAGSSFLPGAGVTFVLFFAGSLSLYVWMMNRHP